MFGIIYLLGVALCTDLCHINEEKFVRLWDGEDFLLAADIDTITASPLNNDMEHRRLVEECRGIVAIDYIYSEKTIVWAESETAPPRINVYQTAKNEFWYFDLHEGSDIKSMAVDWVAKNVYWFDDTDEAIKVCSLFSCQALSDEEPKKKSCSCKTLLLKIQNQKASRDLVIDSHGSRLFFINENSLESVNLDGTNRQVLINSRDVVGNKISGLAMYDRNNLIYGSPELKIHKLNLITDTSQTAALPLSQTMLFSSKRFLSREMVEQTAERAGLSFILSLTSLSSSLQDPLANPCKDSQCSDLCLRSPTGFTCSCSAGLALYPNSTTLCREHPESFIILAKEQVLRRISLDTEEHEYMKLVEYGDSSRSITAVSIDPLFGKIYYSTVYSDEDGKSIGSTIHSVRIDGSNQVDLISDGLAEVEGLALDSQNQLIYWADKIMMHIEVAALTCRCNVRGCLHEHCRRIIVTSKDHKPDFQPRSIVAAHGYIFWTDIASCKIVRAHGSGGSQDVLRTYNTRTSHGCPNKISISDDGNKLFVIVRDLKIRVESYIEVLHNIIPELSPGAKIESQLFKRFPGRDFESIKVFKNSVFVVGQSAPLTEVNAGGQEKRFYGTGHLNSDVLDIQDLSVKIGKNEQICDFIQFAKPGNGRNCQCPDGLSNTLDTSSAGLGRSCKGPELDLLFLLLDDNDNRYKFHQLPIGDETSNDRSTEVHEFEQNNLREPSFDFHYKTDRIFFFAKEKFTTLYTAQRKKTGKFRKPVQITNVGLEGAVKLAVDWIGDSVYWTNNILHRVEQIVFDGSVRRTIVHDCDQPHAIAVDSSAGYIFYSDFSTSDDFASLSRVDMSGENKVSVLGPHSDYRQILSISLDIIKQEMYLLDEMKNSIVKVPYDGTTAEIVYSYQAETPSITSISFYHSVIYWSELKDRSSCELKSLQLRDYSNSRAKTIGKLSSKPLGLTVVAPQVGWGQCNIPRPSNYPQYKESICIAKPTEDEHIHKSENVCSTHFSLQYDICKAPKEFLIFAQEREISRVLLKHASDTTDQIIPIHGIGKTFSMAWDTYAGKGRFYWVDSDKDNQIFSSRGVGDAPVLFLPKERSYAKNIAIHELSGMIFWTLASRDDRNEEATICYAFLTEDGEGKGGKCLDEWTRSEHRSMMSNIWNNIRPDLIVIHQLTGTIIFTNDCKTSDESCQLIFTTNIFEVSSGRISAPTPCVVFEATPPVTAIAVYSPPEDPYLVKLFWSDEFKIYHKEFTIPRHRASICPDQGESKTLSLNCDIESKIIPNGIAIAEDELFWVDGSALKRSKVGQGQSCAPTQTVIDRELKNLTAIAIVRSNDRINDLRYECIHKNCSHFCVADSSLSSSVQCKCPPGLELMRNAKDCDKGKCGDKFTCGAGSGTSPDCIEQIYVCDGNSDCVDGSDESPNLCNRCLENEFSCGNGECIDSDKHCNGIPDCQDGSDERICPITCELNQNRCYDALKCYDVSEKCNGVDDCDDGSDEQDCPEPIDATAKIVIYIVAFFVFFLTIIIIIIVVLTRPRPITQEQNIHLQIIQPPPPLSHRSSMMPPPYHSHADSVYSAEYEVNVPLMAPPPSVISSGVAAPLRLPLSHRQRQQQFSHDTLSESSRGSGTGDSNPPSCKVNIRRLSQETDLIVPGSYAPCSTPIPTSEE
ncbi:Oidioi.mRNA.OKI2018_I69.XSR.g13685.t1.cds [Oikopleura dioica]|uniref:Oidioi.mRNA.OKI2018_I69.XSR.g13685.t1.cds n=1 Tax=Oikopleura dioica TaxID=34765 RepID=A0ABN7SDR5_OIKDI|nr:Oidioi.mRNA.OKI2018_I69.XSR.g13685.t1.cds [Oikopleura dioica]